MSLQREDGSSWWNSRTRLEVDHFIGEPAQSLVEPDEAPKVVAKPAILWNPPYTKPDRPGVYRIFVGVFNMREEYTCLAHWNGVRWSDTIDAFRQIALERGEAVEIERRFNRRQDYPWAELDSKIQ